MADATSNINNSIADYIETMSLDTEGTLKSIDLTLKAIARQDGIMISQSSLKDLAEVERQSQARDRRSPYGRNNNSDNTSNNQNRGYRRRSEQDDFISWDKRSGKARAGKMFDKLTDDFEDAFTEALFGSKNPLQDALNQSVQHFAESLDTDINGLGKKLGQELGDAFKKSKLGGRLTQELNWVKDKAFGSLDKGLDYVSDIINGKRSESPKDIFSDLKSGAKSKFDNFDFGEFSSNLSKDFKNVTDVFTKGPGGFDAETITNSLGNVLNPGEIIGGSFTELSSEPLSAGIDAAADGLADMAAEAGATSTQLVATSEATSAAGSALAATGEGAVLAGEGMAAAGTAAAGVAVAFPVLLVGIAAAAIAIDKLSEAMGPAINGFQSFTNGIANASNRQVTANTKFLELQKARNEADAKAIKEFAYKVIEDSANKVQQVWDNMLTTVSATQGYDKAGVQDLWSAYAQRLKDENLEKVVSSADIMEKLQSVLQSGLSGLVAEEFAYQATLLNAAIPTEDFFKYAATYASIAANAMKDGADQEAAIALANSELNTFADNLLHASRQLAGGFSTSLSDGSDIFKKSAEIALASRTGDVSDISRLLTSVSAVVGSIAPDLADGIVDAVYKAAVGGNSSEITALRSMAGVGASNTAFLQALAKDPQKVFTTLFYNLSQLQNMSGSNYMEVAEGLSSVFGISMDSFARVDFEYLAQAIDKMNETNGDLQKNMDLLAAGQTITNESQLRMQKINEYMIDEGLAYVLDNEVARSIQEHMWQEQLAREIEQSMFAVELQGSALDLLTGISNTVIMISDFLNPMGWVKKVANVALTALEGAGQAADIAEILEKGKVGEGNAEEYHNLTTSGTSLHLAKPYVELLGGVSKQNVVENLVNLNNLINTAVNPAGIIEGIKETGKGMAVIGDALAGLVDDVVDAGTAIIEEGQEIVSNIGEQAEALKPVESNAATSYYKRSIVSKSIASVISSGDWRTNAGYNAIWENFGDSGTDLYGTPTQKDADELSELISTSVREYVKTAKTTSSSLDDFRKTITEDKNDTLIERDIELLKSQGTLQHRGFLTNAEMVDVVASKVTELEGGTDQASFEEWLKKFEQENEIGNLGALLSDYGDTIDTVRAMYEQEQAARQNALTKARELHEVQFWEDMQQFATVDWVWFMREWERYYIQHEAYTKATSDAYQEAIDLSVQEKGELGDSVLALAEALIENNMWAAEDLGHAIKDPQIQTNTLLAKILITVEAIMQQNNETSIVSVPTALSSLGLSISNM